MISINITIIYFLILKKYNFQNFYVFKYKVEINLFLKKYNFEIYFKFRIQ